MITNIRTNDKIVVNSRLSEVEFQYNPNVNSLKVNGDKKAVIKALERFRATWNLETGLEKLIARIDSGFAVQTGINKKSAKNKDIEYFDYCFIDYDGWNKKTNTPIDGIATIQELLSLPVIIDYASFYQKSISCQDVALSIHLFFLFNRRVTPDEQPLLLKLLSMKAKSDLHKSRNGKSHLGGTDAFEEMNGLDPSVEENKGQVCFAGTYKCVEINHENVIDVDAWLVEAKDLGLVYKTEVKNPIVKIKRDVSDSKVESPLEYIQRVIVEGVLEGDYSKLYCLHDHKFQVSSRALEEGAIQQLDGSNPFSPTDSSGTSFSITMCDNGLPPIFLDRSRNFKRINKNGTESPNGTIIDYFYGIGRKDGKYLKGGIEVYFKIIVKEICDYFKVPEYEFKNVDSESGNERKKLNGLIDAIVEDCVKNFEGKIFYISERAWFGWVDAEHVWEIIQGPDFTYAKVFSNYLSEKYTKKISDNVKVRAAVINAFKSGEFVSKIPNEINKYIPMMDTVFNVETKTSEPNVGQGFNRKIYDWKYTPESIDYDFIERFKSYWIKWSCSETLGEIMYIWLALNVQRQAWRTERILGVIGTSGKGKTAYGLLINKLINGLDENGDIALGYAGKPDTNRLLSNGNHSSAVVEGMCHVLLEELTGVGEKSSLAILKNFSGNITNRNIMINPKGMDERVIPFYAGITFDCENFPKMPAREPGYFRRIMFVEVTEESPGLDPIFYKEIENNLEMIFNWAIQQPTDELVARFKELCKSPHVLNSVKNVRLNNEPMADFIIEKLEFTESEQDRLSDTQVFMLFNNIARGDMGYGSPYRTKNSFTLSFKKILFDKGLFGDYQGDHKDMRIDNSKVRGYTHLKIRTDEDTTESEDF